MEIKKISVWKDRKIQIEQFEPYSFGYGAEAELKPDEDIEQAYKDLENWIDRKIEYETLKWKDPSKFLRKNKETSRNPFGDDVKAF